MKTKERKKIFVFERGHSAPATAVFILPRQQVHTYGTLWIHNAEQHVTDMMERDKDRGQRSGKRKDKL